jgi:hypothetical protein
MANISRIPSANERSARFGMREQAVVDFVAIVANKEQLEANVIPSLSLILLVLRRFLTKDVSRGISFHNHEHPSISYTCIFHEHKRVSFLSKIPKAKDKVPVNLFEQLSILLVGIP